MALLWIILLVLFALMGYSYFRICLNTSQEIRRRIDRMERQAGSDPAPARKAQNSSLRPADLL